MHYMVARRQKGIRLQRMMVQMETILFRQVQDRMTYRLLVAIIMQALKDAVLAIGSHHSKSTRNDALEFLKTDRVDIYLDVLGIDRDFYDELLAKFLVEFSDEK